MLEFGICFEFWQRPATLLVQSRDKSKFIKSTLQRYHGQKLGIHQLTSAIIISDSCPASTVDEWIRIAVQNGVKRLELCLPHIHSSYALPRELFEAKTLRELMVYGSNKSLWSNHKVMFSNLQSLHLSNIHQGRNGHLQSAATLFDNLKHKFAQLDCLRLATCYGLEKLDISSHSLKRVMLKDVEVLTEVKIDAPSLLSFEFDLATVENLPDVSLTNVSSRLESKISNVYYELNTCDQFSRLKQFLAKLLPSKISLDLRTNFTWKFDSGMKIPVCTVVEVEVLQLDLTYQLKDKLLYFLDALFLTCYPKAIMLRKYINCDDIAKNYKTKFLHQKLMERRNRGSLKAVTWEINDKKQT